MRKFIVTIDGKNYEVGVEEVHGDRSASSSVVPVAPAVSPAAPAAPAATVGEGEKLVSPFPGLIKELLVKEGDTVAVNQPILVLEAMKMDNDITAPVAGKVSFKVAAGDNVETNTLLAVIG